MDDMVWSKVLNERMYQRKLSNGLNCYIIPKEDFREKSAMISVKYGSVDSQLLMDGETVHLPAGTAHFLEHRMFGDAYFERFARLGASVNAFTGLNVTAYYFSTQANFYECLQLLLEMVQSPGLVEETVDRERDVIAQEIKMYADDPRWVLYLNLMDSMFQVYPVKGNIAGTLESIRLITPKLLRNCHNAFYTSNNMNLVCAGALQADRVFNAAEGCLPGNNHHIKIIRDYGKEPSAVKCDRVMAAIPLAGTMLNLGFKDVNFSKGIDIAKKIAVTRIVLDYVFGESSGLYESLYNRALIDHPFELEFVCGGFYGAAVVSSISSSHALDDIECAVFDELDRLRSGSLDLTRFHQILNKHIGRIARGFNNISDIVMNQSDMLNSQACLFELADSYLSLNPDDFLTRLNMMFTRDNSVLSAVEPTS